jgi:hypothetical protein
MKSEIVIPSVVFGFALAAGIGAVARGYEHHRAEDQRLKAARALCDQWADQLDRQTTETGTYVRHDGETLPASDPWGNQLRVAYSMGGMAELVEVRSLGSDGKTHTEDDVIAVRHSLNMKGIGTGIKNGAEETSRNAARGAVKGIADGTKDVLGFGKKPDEVASK